MKPAKSSHRHLKTYAREPSPALFEAATTWPLRMTVRDGSAASPRTADSVGSRSASSRLKTYSKYIGRVGALAVALGVGGAIASAPGVAWADEPSSPTSSSDPPASESHPPTSIPASDESSIPTSPVSRSSPTMPISTTSPEHSTDDESGGFTNSGGTASPSQTTTTDESGVIVRSSGGAHTSGTDSQSDLEQPITPEVALQAPPKTQMTTPPATPTRTAASSKKNSDTNQVAPLKSPTRTVFPTHEKSDTKQVAVRFADGPAVSTAMGDAGLQLRSSAVTAPAGKNDEWNDQSVGATFTTPLAFASSARELVDLIAEDLAPSHDPRPMGLNTSVMWAVMGWARRQFTERFASRTPVADLAQTTQVEPRGPAQEAPVEGVSVLVAADPPIDGVAAEQVGLVSQAALIEAPTTTISLLRKHPESR